VKVIFEIIFHPFKKTGVSCQAGDYFIYPVKNNSSTFQVFATPVSFGSCIKKLVISSSEGRQHLAIKKIERGGL
jgi:hypothetical protein